MNIAAIKIKSVPPRSNRSRQVALFRQFDPVRIQNIRISVPCTIDAIAITVRQK
jgi:hypothetical protein